MTTTARVAAAAQVEEPSDPRYLPPSATIDPDRSLRWWRRILPILKTRRWAFLVALTLSFVSLIFQVEVPNLLNQAINATVADKGASLEGYVAVVAVLGVLAGITGFGSRWLLFRTAYDFEYDLRNLIFEHLTRLSASFYDRTQSGQLISRANSDIRSVQMYATFAPLIMVQCAIGIVAFGFMLAISVPLALIAMTTMPILLWVSIRMRKVMFPISWIIQARLAEVTTIVDENINGVRVVKSFNQETPQVRALDDASAGVAWAYTQDADLRGRYTPALQNLPQVSLALVLGFGGAMVINGQLGIGAILAFNAYLLMLQAPFMMLGMLVMMSQRAAASADRIFEILDEHPAITDPPDAPEPLGDRRARALRPGELRLRRRARDHPPARPRAPARRDGRPRRPHRVGQVQPGPAPAPALRRHRREHHHRRDRHPLGEPRIASHGRRRRARRALPLLRLGGRQHRLRPA